MNWLLPALIAPIAYSAANLVDNFFVNRRLPNPVMLLFYASMFNLVFLPVIILLDPPQWSGWSTLLLVFVLGVTNFSYLYPYYRALQEGDTSIVIALFDITRLFTPLLAFLFVGEVLHLSQYVGFFLVILSSAALSFEPKKMKFNRSIFYMIIASAVITVEGLVFKYSFEHGMNWGTAMAGQSVFAFLIPLGLLISAKHRKTIIGGWSTFRLSIPLFALEEFFTFIATSTSKLALTMAPLTAVTTMDSLQPMILLIAAKMLHARFPTFFKEEIDRRNMIKKGTLFCVILFGVWLLVTG